MARKKKIPAKQELTESLQQEYQRWTQLYTEGGSDPVWTDGTNLELVRNHIIYAKQRCVEELAKEDYPELFYAELPPVVDRNYMANADRIRKTAIKAIHDLVDSEDYKWLCEMKKEKFSQEKSIRGKFSIANSIEAMKNAIDDDDLVAMRRVNHLNYIERLRDNKKAIEKYLLKNASTTVCGDGQLSFFF